MSEAATATTTPEDAPARVCVRCVMDTSDPDITFDSSGVCNHCAEFEDIARRRLPPAGTGRAALEKLAADIRRAGEGQDYDCVLGLSGGVDSSYTAYQAKQLGLRPLAIHLDNGWDSELAVQNIHGIVSKLGFELYTHVIDWEEFKDVQRSFLLASVVDIEMITDHAITAVIYRVAFEEKIRYILSGNNVATEAVMPVSWVHRKSDLRNLKAIQKRFGTRPIRTLPTASTLRFQYWQLARRRQIVNVLDYLDYNKQEAIATLERELGWRYYGGKHYESFFTRYYQAHILPTKFGIDKRKAHLSALICSGQMTRDEALRELDQHLYDPQTLVSDGEYVRKKLGFTEEEFAAIMSAAPRSHFDFPSDEAYVRPLLNLKKLARTIRGRRRGRPT